MNTNDIENEEYDYLESHLECENLWQKNSDDYSFQIYKTKEDKFHVGLLPKNGSNLFNNPEFALIQDMTIEELKEMGKIIYGLVNDVIKIEENRNKEE